MSYSVVFSPEALSRLDSIEQYIANEASPLVAARYVDAVVNFCESLCMFSDRGTMRDDLFPGLRVTNYRGNAVIAFLVDSDSETVVIVGVFYGGQDHESALLDEDWSGSV
jgi:toxin ParE1/3/4